MEARRLLNESGQRTAVDASYVNQVSHKWQPLLEGIQNPYQRGVMAMVFENQMEHLRSLNEETLSTGVGSFTKYIFPILRRVFPNLIANNIVSVQPMTAPIGGVFTYEHKYGQTKGKATSGNNLIEDFQRNYSSEFIDYQDIVVSTDTDGIKVKWEDATNQAERLPLKWLPVATTNTAKGITGVTVNWTEKTTDLAKSRTCTVTDTNSATGDGVSFKVDFATGEWELDTTGDIPKAGTAIWVEYHYDSERVGTTTLSSLATTYSADAVRTSSIPDVNLDIQLVTIEAITRKLKARWSAEAVDDLRAFHGMNAEAELVAGISNEIALELDREIIDDLVGGSKFSATYALGSNPLGVASSTELETIRGLLTMIDSVSANIHRSSLRAPANFVVVSPEIGAILGQLTSHGDFMMVNRVGDIVDAPSFGPMTSNFGVTRLGTLMNKYAVYQDPFLSAGSTNKDILIGLKGQNFLDAGYVYAPYVPLQVTPTFLDPDDFTFRKGLRTRYAKKMLRPEFYGRVTVSGLPSITSV
ncbi:hypothetical protein CL629_02380 [bacterium]|nr:hypothetical protein [bacterium]|tara:strand:- start:456 stop:2039 length:1584 start_codon:yes stop_codon:yes gene_type:complete